MTALRRTLTPRQYRHVAEIALAFLTLIVFTGAAVRLTGSGLGCPDWPKCYGGIAPPLQTHAWIEFGNRLFTSFVAIAAGAAGVHLRSDSPPASRIRAFVPPAFVIGRSVHSIAEIDATVADGGCNYLLFGTVFPSTGKPAGHPVAGLEALRAACARSPLPVVAIGGVDRSRLPAVADAGAAGYAAIELFMRLTPVPEVV